MDQIFDGISGINWSDFETAYGSASKVPDYLLSLVTDNEEKKLESCHQLWCSLCHQHAFVSSASVPAFPILMKIFEISSEKVQVELMDIFAGFAECTSPKHPEARSGFHIELRKNLKSHLTLWKELLSNENEVIVSFSEDIIDFL